VQDRTGMGTAVVGFGWEKMEGSLEGAYELFTFDCLVSESGRWIFLGCCETHSAFGCGVLLGSKRPTWVLLLRGSIDTSLHNKTNGYTELNLRSLLQLWFI
jgi:hypothetical protein